MTIMATKKETFVPPILSLTKVLNYQGYQFKFLDIDLEFTELNHGEKNANRTPVLQRFSSAPSH
jgi:hypothetical protein